MLRRYKPSTGATKREGAVLNEAVLNENPEADVRHNRNAARVDGKGRKSKAMIPRGDYVRAEPCELILRLDGCDSSFDHLTGV